MSVIKYKLSKASKIGALKAVALALVFVFAVTVPSYAAPTNVTPNGSTVNVPPASSGSSGSGSSGNGNPKGATEDPAVDCTNGNCDVIGKYVVPTINLLSAAFGLIAVISLILGGINYTTSEGDPQKSSRAKKRIFDTIIAVVAYLFLYSFLQFLIPGGAFNR